MLFDLPSDVVISIFMEWLADIKHIVALDIAAAKSVRLAYLSMLGHPSFILPMPLKKATNTSKQVTWINNRAIKLRALEVYVSELNQASEISFYHLVSVNTVKLEDDWRAARTFSGESLRKLLALLPSLASLDLCQLNLGNPKYLTLLAQSCQALQTVKLDGGIKTCVGIDIFVNAYSASLESIDFGFSRQMDAPTLHLLSSTCHRISTLQFACFDIGTDDLIAALGSSRLPLLQYCNIRAFFASRAAMRDRFAAAVFQHHPNLLSFDTEHYSKISIAACAEAVLMCPNLTFFESRDVVFKLKVDKATQRKYVSVQPRYCSLDEHYSHTFATNLIKICSGKYPVEVLSFKPPLVFANSDLRDVLSAAGSTLRILSCPFPNTSDDDDTVQYLSLKCPRLEVLCLQNCAVNDAGLATLAMHSQFLKELNLYESKRFTDFGICYLLHKIGEQLIGLSLLECNGVTHVTLITVAAVCTQLKSFGTSISEDALKVHLISPNRMLHLERLHVQFCDVRNSLRAFAANQDNAVDRRWLETIVI